MDSNRQYEDFDRELPEYTGEIHRHLARGERGHKVFCDDLYHQYGP